MTDVQVTVACVLKSGGDFKPIHVEALARQVKQHLSMRHKFVCFSDVSVPCERIPLQHNWRAWWSKMELFRPDVLGGPVLYVDLDTLVVGQIDEIALGHKFTVLKNFWGSTGVIGSGMMAWDNQERVSEIYAAYARNPDIRHKYVTTAKWGDQGFIRDFGHVTDLWQVKHPGMVVSYKANIRRAPMRQPHKGNEEETIPDNARVICFHGKPRPWETKLGRKVMELVDG